jgi:hypothetical protein
MPVEYIFTTLLVWNQCEGVRESTTLKSEGKNFSETLRRHSERIDDAVRDHGTYGLRPFETTLVKR